jgi:hypothetical protein
MWNEEFILSVYDKRHPIEFNVMTLNSKKPAVGNISFNLHRLADDAEDECSLTTNDPLTPLGAARLHVKFRFTPLSEVLAAELTHEHYNLRLPSFRVVLEKSSYYAGETIIGEVQLNVGGNGLEVHQVGVKVVGLTTINTLEISVKRHVLKQIATLFGHQGEIKRIPPGSYSWPFRFALPKKLPPTYTHHAFDYGATAYKVVAFIDYGTTKLPRKVTVPIQMSVYFSAFDEPARFIKTASNLIKAPRTKLEPEVVKMEVSILSPVVHRGTWVMLRLVLNNKSKHPVSHLKLALHEATMLTSDNITVSNSHTLFRTLYNRKGMPVLPGKDGILEVEVPIPLHMNASIVPEFSPLVHVNHYITVEAYCSGIARGKIRQVIPIVVEAPPPPQAQLQVSAVPENSFQVGVTLTPHVPPPQQVMTKAHPFYFCLPRLAESEWSTTQK